MQRQLVERAIAGDFEAFEALVNASAARQFSIASLILRDRDRAYDAVQEALVGAWRGMSAVRDPDAWDAWLNRLTVRACYAAAKRHRRRSLVELPASPGFDVPVAQDAPTALADRDQMDRELGALPIEQRAVLVLHFYADLPLTEVAMVLGIPAGTAKSRLHRGLETLRTSMGVDDTTVPGRRKERPA
jgi:RNA polymerase sigma-70 factor (ECF subfamily)